MRTLCSTWGSFSRSWARRRRESQTSIGPSRSTQRSHLESPRPRRSPKASLRRPPRRRSSAADAPSVRLPERTRPYHALSGEPAGPPVSARRSGVRQQIPIYVFGLFRFDHVLWIDHVRARQGLREVANKLIIVMEPQHGVRGPRDEVAEGHL